MKIMKKLSAFLAMAMVASTIVVPVSAVDANVDEWTEVIGDTFEGYTDDAAIREKWKKVDGNAEAELSSNGGVDGGKALKLGRTSADNDQLMRKLDAPITSGKVLYKGKFKVEYGDTDAGFLIGVRDSNGYNMAMTFLRSYGLFTNINWGDGGKKFTGYTASAAEQSGKWFDVEAVIDMDALVYDVTVTVDGQSYTLQNKPVERIGGGNFDNISGLWVQGVYGSDGVMYVDDLSVSVPKPAEPWFSDNFEDYSNDTALGNVWKNINGNATPTIVSDNGSKVMKFIRTSDDNNLVERKLAQEITSGEVVYKSKFKIKHGANSNNGKIMVGVRNKAGSQSMNFVYLEQAGMFSNTTWAGGAKFSEYAAGNENDKWFEVEAKINMDTHKYDVVVSDGTKVYTLTSLSMNSVGTPYAISDIGSVFIQTWHGEASATELYLDDVSVSKYVEPTPEPEDPSDGYISDNFEKYADTEAIQAKWTKVDGNALAELSADGGVGGGKALKLGRTLADNDQLKRDLASPITSGKVVYKGKFKVEYGDTDAGFLIGVRDSNGYNMALTYLRQYGLFTNINWNDGSKKFSGYTASAAQAGKWFDVEAVIDMDNKLYDITVTVDGQSYTLQEKSVERLGGGSFDNISALWVQGVYGSDGAMYVDDLSIKDYVEPEPEDSSLIMSDNFEDYTDTAALQKTWIQQLGEKIELATGKSEDGSNAARISGKTTDNNWSAMTLPSVVSSGKVKYKAKFMAEYEEGTSFGANLLFRDSKGIAFSVVYLTQLGLYTNTNWNDGGKKFSGYTASAAQSGKWFDVEATFDLDRKKYDVSVTDEDGNVYTLLDKNIICIDGKQEFKDFSKVCIQTVPGTGGYMYVDDISMSYVLEPIVVEAQNITTVKASGEEASLANTVSASTSAIKINFGTAVKEDTLTDQTVVLKNVTDNKTVAYTGTLEGSTYTMTLSKLLEAGKSYQLSISKNIKTPAGGTLEADKSFTFTADNGECMITLTGAKVGANAAPTVADFKAAQKAAATVKIINSTNIDKDLLLIVSYYKDKEMTGVTYKPVKLTKSEYENKTFDVEIDLPANADADNVRIFAWDKITSMVPYGAYLDI